MAKKATRSRDTNAPDETYYYAGGRRIDLARADDLLAIDERQLAKGAVPDAVRKMVKKSARPLMSGLALVRRVDLGDDAAQVVSALKAAAALQPVYRAHGAVLVVLPEVRVEETREAEQVRLEQWLQAHAQTATVESRQDGRIVLKAASGYGGDALKFANALTEEVQPEMAQARFLRVTPRPSTMRG